MFHRAGYKLTVIDTSDPDWWKGKCLGKVGFFPSKYITKLQAGERPLQVTHNLQVTDGQDGMRLLRDQASNNARRHLIYRRGFYKHRLYKQIIDSNASCFMFYQQFFYSDSLLFFRLSSRLVKRWTG